MCVCVCVAVTETKEQKNTIGDASKTERRKRSVEVCCCFREEIESGRGRLYSLFFSIHARNSVNLVARSTIPVKLTQYAVCGTQTGTHRTHTHTHTHANRPSSGVPIKPQFTRQRKRTLSRARHTKGANLLETRMIRGRSR